MKRLITKTASESNEIKYIIYYGYRVFDGKEPQIKTYETLSQWNPNWVDNRPDSVDEVWAYNDLKTAYNGIKKLSAASKNFYPFTEDGIIWWMLDEVDDVEDPEWCKPIDLRIYVCENDNFELVP